MSVSQEISWKGEQEKDLFTGVWEREGGLWTFRGIWRWGETKGDVMWQEEEAWCSRALEAEMRETRGWWHGWVGIGYWLNGHVRCE